METIDWWDSVLRSAAATALRGTRAMGDNVVTARTSMLPQQGIALPVLSAQGARQDRSQRDSERPLALHGRRTTSRKQPCLHRPHTTNHPEMMCSGNN